MDYPIRVLHVIGSMNRGGAETMIMNYYRHIDRSKIQFDFVENTFEPAAFDDEIRKLGGRIYNCPHYNGKNHFAYKKWWKAFFEEHKDEYQIVHGHIGSTAAIYLAVAKEYGLYTIAHSHNTRTSWNARELLYAIYAYPTRHIADRFFACSYEAGVSRYGKVFSADKDICSIISNAIDTDDFVFDPEKRNQMREQLGVEDKFVVGHVGRFMNQKNHSFLIDIFSELHKTNEDSVLLLIGGGLLENSIKKKVDELQLADSVIFAGIQSNMPDFYQAMDVFVLPSLFEGLGIVNIEAQTSGLPCYVSTGVSKEAKISELLKYIPLEKGAGYWAEQISVVPNNRVDMREEIKNAGYDITENAAHLCEIYMEIAEREQ